MDTNNTFLNSFMANVVDERNYQQGKWGDKFDEKNTPNDWISYITKYAGQAVTMPWDASKFREQLVKVACLCAAAVEWCDRTDGKMPKRHYDE